jgi:hypothetical protein
MIVIFLSGCIAGLVAITPAAGYVNPTGAFIIGAAGGIACSQGVKIKNYFNFDDALDAFGIHAVGGVVGGLLLGCFATEHVGGNNGLFYGNPRQLGLQFYGIVVTMLWSGVMTGLIFVGVDKTIGLRVDPRIELAGLDRAEHGSTMDAQMVNLAKRRTNGKFLLYCCCCVLGDVAGAREAMGNERVATPGRGNRKRSHSRPSSPSGSSGGSGNQRTPSPTTLFAPIPSRKQTSARFSKHEKRDERDELSGSEHGHNGSISGRGRARSKDDDELSVSGHGDHVRGDDSGSRAKECAAVSGGVFSIFSSKPKNVGDELESSGHGDAERTKPKTGSSSKPVAQSSRNSRHDPSRDMGFTPMQSPVSSAGSGSVSSTSPER